jgi:hypothetical protein
MASLALIVVFLFLIVLLSGPLSLLFAYLGWPFLCLIMCFASFTFSLNWAFVAPFPVSSVGVISVVLSCYSIYYMVTH